MLSPKRLLQAIHLRLQLQSRPRLSIHPNHPPKVDTRIDPLLPFKLVSSMLAVFIQLILLYGFRNCFLYLRCVHHYLINVSPFCVIWKSPISNIACHHHFLSRMGEKQLFAEGGSNWLENLLNIMIMLHFFKYFRFKTMSYVSNPYLTNTFFLVLRIFTLFDRSS